MAEGRGGGGDAAVRRAAPAPSVAPGSEYGSTDATMPRSPEIIRRAPRLLNKGPYEPKNAEPCASPPKIQFLTKVARHFTKGTAKVTAVVGRRCFSGALAVPHARTPAEGVLSAY